MTSTESWERPESGRRKETSNKDQGADLLSSLFGVFDPNKPESSPREPIRLNPELESEDTTANLDSLTPPTLYYLGRIIDIPEVAKVYIEDRQDGSIKHWAVLKDREFDVMDQIYTLEEDTLDRFPMANLNFRVTVDREEGPTISNQAEKVYDDC